MKPYNGKSYMESYTDAEHEAYWGDELLGDEEIDLFLDEDYTDDEDEE